MNCRYAGHYERRDFEEMSLELLGRGGDPWSLFESGAVSREDCRSQGGRASAATEGGRKVRMPVSMAFASRTAVYAFLIADTQYHRDGPVDGWGA